MGHQNSFTRLDDLYMTTLARNAHREAMHSLITANIQFTFSTGFLPIRLCPDTGQR